MHAKRITHGALTAAALTLLLGALPSLAFAQEAMEEEAETRVVTVTTFHVPFNDMAEVTEVIETYIMPQTLADPNVLAFRFGTHSWGNAKMNAWMITEYASMAAMDASTEWGNDWFEQTYPEGTPEREKADAATETFLKYFDGHQDNILVVSMDHAK